MNRSSGFTLAELAVALVIIALLLAGAIIPLSAQVEVRNISDTQRAMEQIKESIIGFALANGRLPCPASGTIASGVTNAGAEQVTGTNCTTAFGVVPWATLGVAEADSWGRRFSYRVAPAFGDGLSNATYKTSATLTSPTSPQDQNPDCAPTPTPSLSSFALCSLGDIAAFTRNETTKTQVAIGAGLAAIIISHGKNGYGAFQTNGTRVIGANDGNGNGVPDQNLDESSNVDATTLGNPFGSTYSHVAFYSRDRTSESSTCSDTTVDGSPLCEFDDIVVMLSSSIMVARMVSAGRLP